MFINPRECEKVLPVTQIRRVCMGDGGQQGPAGGYGAAKGQGYEYDGSKAESA